MTIVANDLLLATWGAMQVLSFVAKSVGMKLRNFTRQHVTTSSTSLKAAPVSHAVDFINQWRDDYPMQFEGKYSDYEKRELEKLFKEMYYIKETDEWITSAHDWDEEEAINFIRQKAIRKANQVIEDLTGEKPQDDTYVGFDCPACGIYLRPCKVTPGGVHYTCNCDYDFDSSGTLIITEEE